MQGGFYQQGSTFLSYHPQQAFDILNYHHLPTVMQRQRRSWKTRPAPKAAVSPPRPHSDHFLFAHDNLGQLSFSIAFPQPKHPSRIKLCDIKASPSGIASTNTPDPLVTTSKTPLNVSTGTNWIGNCNSHGDGNNIKEQVDLDGGVDIGTPPKMDSHNKPFDDQQQEHHQQYQQGQLNSTLAATYSVSPYRTHSTGHRRFPLYENHDYYQHSYTQLHHHLYNSYPHNGTYHPHYYQQQRQYWRHQYPIVMYDYQYQYMDKEDEKHQRRISASNTSNSTGSSSSGLIPRRFSSGSSGSSCKSTLASSTESTFTDNNDTSSAPLNSESMVQVVAISSEDYGMDPLLQQHNEDHTADTSSICNVDTQIDTVTENDDGGPLAPVIISKPDTEAEPTIIDEKNSDSTTTDPAADHHPPPPSISSSVDSCTPPSEPASPTSSASELATNTLPIWADPIKVRENPTRYRVIQDYMAQHKLSYTSSLPLNRNVVFYFGGDTTQSKTTVSNYRSSMQPLFTCQTVWEFSSSWRYCKEKVPGLKPSQMVANQNLYCFQEGVEPMWEDKVNKNGGRLTLTLDTTTPRTDLLLDTLFDWILCAFVGGNLVKYGMVGLVLSKRARADRIELWLDASSTHPDTLAALKGSLLSIVPSAFHEPVLSSSYKKHYN